MSDAQTSTLIFILFKIRLNLNVLFSRHYPICQHTAVFLSVLRLMF